LHCNFFDLSSYISIYCSILFSLHFSLLHNLSWYQSFSSKPLHTVWRATRSSQRRASQILRARDTELFTRIGELSAILSKDPRRKLPRGSRPSYVQKINVGILQRLQSVLRSKERGSRDRERRNFKDSCTFFKNRQRLTKKSCRMEERLKNSKNSFKIVKDCCRRQHRLKFFEIHSNLSKIEAVNKESMYFFQIFERFTDLSSTGAKNASQVQRTTVATIRFVLRMDLKRETSSEGMRRARKRRKSFSR
jgi:hypothetical protein